MHNNLVVSALEELDQIGSHSDAALNTAMESAFKEDSELEISRADFQSWDDAVLSAKKESNTKQHYFA